MRPDINIPIKVKAMQSPMAAIVPDSPRRSNNFNRPVISSHRHVSAMAKYVIVRLWQKVL
jgi:hypothetical protein